MIAGRVIKRLAAHQLPVLLVCALGAIALIGQSTPPAIKYVFTLGFVYLVIVVGLYTFVGLSGVVSFGHMAFMGVGAYISALVSIPPSQKQALLPALPHWLQSLQLGLLPSVLLGGAGALLLSLILAVPVLRIIANSAGIMMFAVLIGLNVVESNWTQVTNGTAEMIGTPTTANLGTVFIAGSVAVVLAYVLQRSSAGLRLKATREDEAAARAIGISIPVARAYGFVMSAFLVGCGGGLYGHLVGAFSASDFYLDTTLLTLVMLIVGGMNSLTGAVVGTALIAAIQEVLAVAQGGFSLGFVHVGARPGLSQVGLAVVLVAVLLLRPSGLTQGRELRLHMPRALRRSRRMRPEVDGSSSAPIGAGNAGSPGDAASDLRPRGGTVV